MFHDGDRLAGDSPTGANVTWQGSGAPMFSPNQFGSLSFLLRRGSIPAGGAHRVPFMGIEFLGGPLLDLDGDLGNSSRSLIPVADPNDSNLPVTPLAIPGQGSRIDLTFDTGGGTVALDRFDATGTNEGASDRERPGRNADVFRRQDTSGESDRDQPDDRRSYGVRDGAWHDRRRLADRRPGFRILE
jgi:hypothetical protein